MKRGREVDKETDRENLGLRTSICEILNFINVFCTHRVWNEEVDNSIINDMTMITHYDHSPSPFVL